MAKNNEVLVKTRINLAGETIELNIYAGPQPITQPKNNTPPEQIDAIIGRGRQRFKSEVLPEISNAITEALPSTFFMQLGKTQS